MAYGLALPPELSRVHPVFHVSMLRKYIRDKSQVLSYVPIKLQDDLSYEIQPIAVIERSDCVLRNKTIPMVKVLWRSLDREETSWEVESVMRVRHPQLFEALEF